MRGLEKLPLLDCIEISSELGSHGQTGGDGVVPGSHDVMTNKYLVTLTRVIMTGGNCPIMSLCVKTARRKHGEFTCVGGRAKLLRDNIAIFL